MTEKYTPTLDDLVARLPSEVRLLAERQNSAKRGFVILYDKDGTEAPELKLQFGGNHEARVPLEAAAQFAKWDFENWLGLSGYNAYYNDKEDAIVAQIGFQGSGVDALAGIDGFETYEGPQVEGRRYQRASGQLNVSDPASSQSLCIKTGDLHEDLTLFTGRRTEAGLTIRNARFKAQDPTLDFLNAVASSLFFQIDLQYGVRLQLVRAPRVDFFSRFEAATSRTLPKGRIAFPRVRFTDEPLQHYFFAREKAADRLLSPAQTISYHAFYQVLEFFMSAYARATLHRQVRNLLKDPRLDVDDDRLVGRLLALTAGAAKSVTERDQLRAVVTGSVDEDELRHFLESDEQLSTRLSDKATISGVPTLRLKDRQSVLAHQVADRVYGIRCRIVHAKDALGESDAVSPLLPSSPEAERLRWDLELITFLAQKALIAAGRTLHG